MKNKTTIIFVIVILVIIAGFFVFNSFLKKNIESGVEQTEVVKEIAPEIVVPKQAGGTNVFIESVTLNSNGYVVVHKDKDGDLGDIIGVSKLLLPGTTDNFLMNINEEVTEGDSLFAVVHLDDGDGVFGASLDAPATDADGNKVMVGFPIVNEGSLDNEIKL